MAHSYVQISHDAGVLRVLINRAEKRNALSLSVLNELGEAFSSNAADDGLIAAVVTGAGGRCFAAGGDLQELDNVRDQDSLDAMATAAFNALNAIREFPVPVIGALNGDAIGGGAEFALSCDMRVFAAHARIAFVQGTLSVSPAWGGGVDLMRHVGAANALRLLSRADFIAAEEAVHLGLAQAVAGDDESLEEAVARFLRPMRQMKPQVMRAFKTLAREYRYGSDPQTLRQAELTSLSETWLHQDHWDAAAAVQARIAKSA